VDLKENLYGCVYLREEDIRVCVFVGRYRELVLFFDFHKGIM
jgi:hypothetical protein